MIFILIVLIGSTVQLLIAGNQLQNATLEFYRHHLETDAFLISANLSDPMEKYLENEGTSSIRQTIANLQRADTYNYLIVDRQYQLIGYTADHGYEQVQRLAETPELAVARTNHVGSDIRPDASGADTLYVAISILYEQDILGYLVLFRPMQPAYDEVARHWLELAVSLIPVVGLVIVGSLWISETIVRPIEDLRNSALVMASGQLETRIRQFGNDEIGQLAGTFNYMAAQIESLLKAQRSFVSNAAHELRTPLMTLKLRAEVMNDERLPPAERATYLNQIISEVDYMAQLVSSLLVLARIDEGRHKSTVTTGDMLSALQDMMRFWRIASEKKHLQFAYTLPDDWTDSNLPLTDIRLIVDNLVGNAVKYTVEGRISVEIQHLAGKCWRIQVQDTGIGFEPQQASNLFERFYRTQEARGTYQGHGLGLSIIQALVEQYGGTVHAESAGIGKGATFTVTLPENV